MLTTNRWQQNIQGNIAGNFGYHHGNAAVRRRAHCPIEHIQSFAQSHWMLPSVDCLHCIHSAAAMVDDKIE